MSQSNVPRISIPQDRTIVSRPIGNETVLTLIGAGDLTRGPWPCITGIPNQTSDMVGPPSQYLSVAAWAA